MWGFDSIGVGFGSIGVGFGFRAGGAGSIAVGLGLAGCPASGDTGEAEGVSELWEAAVAKEALAGCCLLLSWSFWSQKRQPTPRTGAKRRFAWSQEDTSRNNRAKTAPATQMALAKG